MLRSSTRNRLWFSALLLAGALQGCDSLTSPNSPLVVEARLDSGHIHTFETDVTFFASATEAGGESVRDFITIRAEIGPYGTNTWTKQIPLSFDGTEYSGTTKFTAPGTFDARIVGRRPGQSGVVELYRYDPPLSAVRPHFDAGGYRVEFETDTGEYPRVGQTVTYRFLIMEDVPNPRPPVTGLTGVAIHCIQGSDVGVHAAAESPAGTYSASHAFTGAGGATARIEFTGSDQNPASVEIPLTVE